MPHKLFPHLCHRSAVTGLVTKHSDPLQRAALSVANRGAQLLDVPFAVSIPLSRLDRRYSDAAHGGLSGDDQVNIMLDRCFCFYHSLGIPVVHDSLQVVFWRLGALHEP